MEGKEKNLNLKIFADDKFIINIISVLLGSGLFYALLYFFGYSYLKDYFSKIGGAMIPISDLPSLEIAISGLVPFLVFIILLLFVYYICKILFLLCNFFARKLKKIINNGKETKIIFLILTVLFLPLYFLVTSLFSSYVVKNNLPYNFFITLGKKIPVVEIVYNTPLINRQKLEGNVENNNFKCKTLNIGEIKSGKMRFLKEDNYFRDVIGNLKYVGNFELYFISKDNYYLKSRESFINPNQYVRLEDADCDGNIYKYIDVDGLVVSLYDFIVLPKEKIESIKYLKINFKDQSTG